MSSDPANTAETTSAAAFVDVANVTQTFGAVNALDDVDLQVRQGEFLTLLGPSGCGKSTLLRAIAGFEVPTSGGVHIDGADMRRVPPNKRPVNMVFQRPTLFPHLDVAGNVAFGLRLAGVPKAQVAERVDAALRMVRLEAFAQRRSHELSGGQQQRAAMARALVNRPKVLLLDEPLSALDLRIRLEMEVELRRLHRESGSTFVYVTHDQREALALSDRIAVLDRGRIIQLGTPHDVFHRPINRFIASFVGAANVIPATNDGGTWFVGSQVLPADMVPDDAPATADAELVVRPQVARFVTSGGIEGTVIDAAFRGLGQEFEVQIDGLEAPFKVETSTEAVLTFGERVHVSWPARSVRVLEVDAAR